MSVSCLPKGKWLGEKRIGGQKAYYLKSGSSRHKVESVKEGDSLFRRVVEDKYRTERGNGVLS